MKRSEIIDYIKSFADKLVFGSLASYEEVPTTSDLVNEDIPAWQNINELIGNILLDPVLYNINAEDPNPVTIDYASLYSQFGNTPNLQLFIIGDTDPDTGIYTRDLATFQPTQNVGTDGTLISLTIDDPDPSDPTKVANNLLLIIKP